MFDKDQDRYITRGVKNTLSTKLQIVLWGLIAELKEQAKKDEELEVDYLQVFQLEPNGIKDGQEIQQVIHSQEKLDYKRIIYVPVKKAVNEKLFAIDDKSHSTLLLAKEY